LEINDLREFRPPPPSPLAWWAEDKRQNTFATKEHTEHKRKIFFLCALSVRQSLPAWPAAADVPFCGPFIPGFPRPLSLPPIPLQNVKEQAPEHLTYSTLPRFDGNASLIIQLFSRPAEFSAFFDRPFSRRGAESAEVKMEICEATYCETMTCSCVKK
jgi:hypothetical protein